MKLKIEIILNSEFEQGKSAVHLSNICQAVHYCPTVDFYRSETALNHRKQRIVCSPSVLLYYQEKKEREKLLTISAEVQCAFVWSFRVSDHDGVLSFIFLHWFNNLRMNQSSNQLTSRQSDLIQLFVSTCVLVVFSKFNSSFLIDNEDRKWENYDSAFN